MFFFCFLVVVDVIVCSIPPTLSFIIFYIIFAVCLRASLLLFIFLFFLKKEKITPLFTPAICYMTNLFAPLKFLSPSLDDFETNVNWLWIFFGREMKTKKNKIESRERDDHGGCQQLI